MRISIPTHVFIDTLTDLVNQHRERRASALARYSKEKTMRFLRHRPDSDPIRPLPSPPHPMRTAETPDCVSFFSNTLKGTSP